MAFPMGITWYRTHASRKCDASGSSSILHWVPANGRPERHASGRCRCALSLVQGARWVVARWNAEDDSERCRRRARVPGSLRRRCWAARIQTHGRRGPVSDCKLRGHKTAPVRHQPDLRNSEPAPVRGSSCLPSSGSRPSNQATARRSPDQNSRPAQGSCTPPRRPRRQQVR
jgi:hypothetical protein